jgi:hypothetical protein
MSTIRLNQDARQQLDHAGISMAAYARALGWADGVWGGDKCGCADDRCIGFHHDAGEDCGCLQVLLTEAVAAQMKDEATS